MAFEIISKVCPAICLFEVGLKGKITEEGIQDPETALHREQTYLSSFQDISV